MKKVLKRSLWFIAIVFIFANVVAAMHAYKFTHFGGGGDRPNSFDLTTSEKLSILFTGINNPRPQNTYKPWHPYTTVVVKSNVNVECWYIPALVQSKGTVLLFHGYMSNKSASLSRAEPLLKAGYNCLLVDFMGSGGSGGNTTTIGFKEAQEVSDCYDYIRSLGEKRIFLYGSSMGAASVMKAVNDHHMQLNGIIVDAPFASMYRTVSIRFRHLGIPVFPMAGIMVFWGGVENGFWAFSHNPVDYAKNIKCPVLLQYGAQDDRVGKDEIYDIYMNLHCDKKLAIYPLSGHDDFVRNYTSGWTKNMLAFLNNH